METTIRQARNMEDLAQIQRILPELPRYQTLLSLQVEGGDITLPATCQYKAEGLPTKYPSPLPNFQALRHIRVSLRVGFMLPDEEKP